MADPFIKYYKGELTGVFRSKERAALHTFHFNEIEWHQLKITAVESVPAYHSWELRTGGSWYRKKVLPYKDLIRSRQIIWRWPILRTKADFPWLRSVLWQLPTIRKRPHLVIPLNDAFQLQDTLHEVVIKRLQIRSDEWMEGLREASGVIWFQIHVEPEPVKNAIAEKGPVNVPEIVADVPKAESTGFSGAKGLNDISWIDQNPNTSATDPLIAPAQKPLQMSGRGNSGWRWFMLLWLAFCLWKLPALLVPSLLFFGAVSFFRYFRKACLGLLGSLLLFGVVLTFLLRFLPHAQNEGRSKEETKEGSVRILPPKDNGKKDLLSEKQITWWDFFKKRYDIAYRTSSTAFFESQQFNASAVEHANGVNNIALFGQLYAEMQQNDTPKLDSIIRLFSKRSQGKNAMRTAEIVCTFVQEIPYFLVHDDDCKTAVRKAGSGFMVEYHQQNKPCLPNIPAGVQSPYEFMHNLKGDCDTRALLAFTILKKMGIPASVWISETFGHSVLGVGLPVGSGFYKEVNGIKHYAVELTAKGFRLGMISPEQQIGSNWDIALYFNR
jgi:hypothetical protein